ncbi:DUF6625 family protein [Bacillus mesophilum]|uniref:Uncharacterized protein n=1 Tax=Bacillus mesophilum TaxID=1071718 RepID=A0A7V7RLH8_9BACI|nr:DUF6625 family protein [Bacillus mesophilum]KAB2332605.1 hypothetical protein F7732_10965 [Bacillus mesophilum]
MYKICIIGIYFGKLPEYFPLWLKSCQYNETIDFLMITDQEIKEKPDNVKIKNMSFDEFKNLVQSKFEFKIALNAPYKICDFKPAFGVICEEYLKEYQFWGHCDFDMIFGDLRGFLTQSLLNSYDKILPLGHLSLYSNNIDNNNRFKLPGSNVGDYKTVFSTDRSFAFDETRGVLQIYKKNKLSVYEKRIFADISSIYKRFRLALNDMNYKYQIFCFENGKVYREYIENGSLKKDEFIYIHIKKPKNLKINLSGKSYCSYFITNSGFYDKKFNTEINDIKQYNNYRGYLYELYEKERSKLTNRLNRILVKLRVN